MLRTIAQAVYTDASGDTYIQDDWFPKPLPKNAFFDKMTYPDTAYSFSNYHSEAQNGFSMGFASGNYGHSLFSCGTSGKITIGRFVVLEGTNLISNESITIGDHCMFSWGSVITDSWITPATIASSVRKSMLEALAQSANRHLEFIEPKPVMIKDNVWIGFGAVVLPGVTIGQGAVIGCKTVVAEDVPPYAVVAGNPAKVIRFLRPTDTAEAKKEALRAFGLNGFQAT